MDRTYSQMDANLMFSHKLMMKTQFGTIVCLEDS